MLRPYSALILRITLAKIILDMLDQWQISREREVLVLRDGGANVVKAM